MDWQRLDDTSLTQKPEAGGSDLPDSTMVVAEPTPSGQLERKVEIINLKKPDVPPTKKFRAFTALDLLKNYEVAIRGSSAFIDRDLKEMFVKECADQKLDIKNWEPFKKIYEGLAKAILDLITDTTLTVLELDEYTKLVVRYDKLEESSVPHSHPIAKRKAKPKKKAIKKSTQTGTKCFI